MNDLEVIKERYKRLISNPFTTLAEMRALIVAAAALGISFTIDGKVYKIED